jgi:hypothetical protein
MALMFCSLVPTFFDTGAFHTLGARELAADLYFDVTSFGAGIL